MSTMIFYDKIVPLNRDQHRKLRLKPSETKARFAGGTHYVPIAGIEFYQAARDFPLLFTGDASNGPIALLGLRPGENLFIEDDGAWLEGVYVPAFVRRYPFILARGEADDKRTVCIDAGFPGFGESEGTALFEDDGTDSTYLSGVIDFLNRFAADMEITRAFSERLNELELLVSRNLRVTDGKGRNFMLNDFRIIDETKLAGLDDATLGDLHRRGWLGWIYAHLVSLGNVNRLPVRLVSDDASSASAQESAHQDAAQDQGKKRKKK